MSISLPTYTRREMPLLGRRHRFRSIIVTGLRREFKRPAVIVSTLLGVALIVIISTAILLFAGLFLPGQALDLSFFFVPASNQTVLFFITLMASLVGSALIADDLNSMAPTLYLSRPITHADYLVAKAAILAPLISLIAVLPLVLTPFVAALLGLFSWTIALQAIGLAVGSRNPACRDPGRGVAYVSPNEGRRGGRGMTAVAEAAGVSKWYGEVLGLNAFTASFGTGITGLVGPNGAGKSTLFKLLIGQLHANQGTLQLLGENPWNNVPMMRRLGYCPEHNQMYGWLSGQQFVEALLRLDGMLAAKASKAASAALKVVGLSSAAHRPTRTYSRGMRQRAKLAQALAHDPEVLILDEPLSGADPVARVP